jgi:benzoyl-CoA reductase/2-hydroxyglutaryl-CoA dehydratase subunit BcrC/BadD/HgdB
MRRFIKTLEDHFGISITDENLGKVILTYNETRKMFKKMDEIRASSAAISGEDALAVAVAASAMPRDEFNAMLATMIEGLEKTNGGRDGRKRLLLVGSINDDLDFVRVIEECGAVIAGDSLCFGARSYESMVDEEGDPVEALSRRYLDTNLCPRMFGAYRDRLAFIKKQVARTRANGVILQNIRFCDIHGSENGIFARDLEAEGIPCVRMEREYGPLVESGRVKMRVEAFLERL